MEGVVRPVVGIVRSCAAGLAICGSNVGVEGSAKADGTVWETGTVSSRAAGHGREEGELNSVPDVEEGDGAV